MAEILPTHTCDWPECFTQLANKNILPQLQTFYVGLKEL
uniref:Uncharacterized protein n=1 Tax=Anguilla anguilla TaxID=7936 RepID=A0A0E9VV40_ANGAN